jgi:hypothetical protein
VGGRQPTQESQDVAQRDKRGPGRGPRTWGRGCRATGGVGGVLDCRAAGGRRGTEGQEDVAQSPRSQHKKQPTQESRRGRGTEGQEGVGPGFLLGPGAACRSSDHPGPRQNSRASEQNEGGGDD